MAEWKAGDVVKLKSGGPEMTIKEVEEGGAVLFCYWFDSKDALQHARFGADTVNKPAQPGSGMRITRS